eukprot:XP_001700219.1 predicted protein [Chlamydomonas reinhardtii]
MDMVYESIIHGGEVSHGDGSGQKLREGAGKLAPPPPPGHSAAAGRAGGGGGGSRALQLHRYVYATPVPTALLQPPQSGAAAVAPTGAAAVAGADGAAVVADPVPVGTAGPGGAAATAAAAAAAAATAAAFTLVAEDTVMVCDHPVSAACVRDNGPEFCVKREIAARLAAEERQSSSLAAAVGATVAVTAMAVGWWVLAARRRSRKAAAAAAEEEAAAAQEQQRLWAHSAAVAAGESGGTEVQQALEVLLRQLAVAGDSAAPSASAAPSTSGDGRFVRMSGSSNSRTTSRNPSRTVSRTSTRNPLDAGAGGGAAAAASGLAGPTSSSVFSAVSQTTSANQHAALALALAPANNSNSRSSAALGTGGGSGAPPSAVSVAAAALAAAVANANANANTGSGAGTGAAAQRIESLRRSMRSEGPAIPLSPVGVGGGGSSSWYGSSGGTDDLEITDLLGAGTFGKVFKGFWHGTLVAVKHMVFPRGVLLAGAAVGGTGGGGGLGGKPGAGGGAAGAVQLQLERMAAMEAAISTSLSHPNVVQTYTWRVTPLGDAAQPHDARHHPASAPRPGLGVGPGAGQGPALRRSTVSGVGSAGTASVEAQTQEALPPLALAGQRQQRASDTGPQQGPGSPLAWRSLPGGGGVAGEAGARGPPLPPRHHSGEGQQQGGQGAQWGAVASQQQQQQQQQEGHAEPCLHSNAAALEKGFELCLILELCDMGSLRDHLARGGFRCTHDHGSVDHGAVLDLAMDVARAMSYLHSKNIVHSDLKSRNVLLKSLSGPPGSHGRCCPLVAKVSDFGLAFKMEGEETHVSGMYQGTLAWSAPELLMEGRVSKAADVYSFGVLLWEMYTCGEAFKGIPRPLLAGKVVEGLRPDFPPETPPEYMRLAAACWGHDPAQRPSFDQVVRELACMRAAWAGGRPPTGQLGSVSAQVQRRDSLARVSASRVTSARGTAGGPPPPTHALQLLQVANLSSGGNNKRSSGRDGGAEANGGGGASPGPWAEQPRANHLLDEALGSTGTGVGDGSGVARPLKQQLLSPPGGAAAVAALRLKGASVRRRTRQGHQSAAGEGVRMLSAKDASANSDAGGSYTGSGGPDGSEGGPRALLGVGLDTADLIDKELLVVGGGGGTGTGTFDDSSMWGL